MRLLITTPVYPPEIGGPATFVPRLATHLVNHGHQVSVLTFADGPIAPAAGYEVVPVPRIWLPARYAVFFGRALRLARHADLVLACEHPSIFSIAAAHLVGRKVALRVMVDTAWELSFRFGWTRADPDSFRSGQRRLGPRLLQALQRWGLHRADLVVAVSEHLARMAREIGVAPSRVFVSYNLPRGVEETSAVALDASAASADAGVVRLLVVARLVSWKGLEHVLDAVESLSDRFQLAIVGEGPDLTLLERRVANSALLRSRVAFTGRLSPNQVQSEMRTSDILILMSLYEGLSHVLVEAMDAGLAIVASDNPGNRELITNGDNGVLLAWGDSVGLAQALEQLASDPAERSRLAARSAERLADWRTHHSLARLTARLEQVLQSES